MVTSIMLGFVGGILFYSTELSKKKNIISAILSCVVVILINMGIWYFRSL